MYQILLRQANQNQKKVWSLLQYLKSHTNPSTSILEIDFYSTHMYQSEYHCKIIDLSFKNQDYLLYLFQYSIQDTSQIFANLGSVTIF